MLEGGKTERFTERKGKTGLESVSVSHTHGEKRMNDNIYNEFGALLTHRNLFLSLRRTLH